MLCEHMKRERKQQIEIATQPATTAAARLLGRNAAQRGAGFLNADLCEIL